jgi:peroxiredoxin
VLIVLGVLLLVAAGYLLLKPAPDDPQKTLPAFELEALGGAGTISDADLIGHPVVMNFWASWCGPCNEEAPDLEKTWQEYKDKGVEFLGVDVQDIETNAQKFVDKYRLTYSMVKDPDQKLAKAMGVGIGLPQTFFIDAKGNVVEGSGLGLIDDTELRAQLDRLLEGS